MKYLGKTIGAALLLGVSCASNASFIVNGEIESIYDGINKIGSTVDKWSFSVLADSTVSIDVLSWEADEDGIATNDRFPEAVDLNGDGVFTFIDSFIYLFADDRDLTADDLIGFNDDSSLTFADGSLSFLDSFLEVDLFAGNYILAIGASDSFGGLLLQDAISGVSSVTEYPAQCIDDPFFGCFLEASDVGDYQISFTGNVAQTVNVSEPYVLSLFGLGLLGFGLRKRANAL
jgi:hypothetical protein